MKTIKGNKAQSCINLNPNDKSLSKSYSSSLKPFPTIDPEFYNEGNNYFWQKEIKKISSEKSIFGKTKPVNNSMSDSRSRLFYSVIYLLFSRVYLRKNCLQILKLLKKKR